MLCLAAILAAGWPAGADAQDKPVDEVVVEGRAEKQLDQMLQTFAPSRSGHQMARWDRRVCTRIYGLEPVHAAFVKERIDALADQVGLGAAKSPHCVPDIVIAFTLDADAVTAGLIKRHPELVGDIDFGEVTARTKAAYLAPHPVRWFGQDWNKVVDLTSASRIKTNSLRVISTTVSVVDLTKLDGINWGQLADFLGFVSLSRPRFDHVYSDPGTVLSLFTARDLGKPIPAGLTALDSSFLTNLYKTQARQTAEHQQQDIRRHVKADLAKAAN